MKKLNIALVAPPWYPVPPHGYGGIELVVSLLATGLRQQGHQVHLFGAEGSENGTIVCAPKQWRADLGLPQMSPRPATYTARVSKKLRSFAAILWPVAWIYQHSGFFGPPAPAYQHPPPRLPPVPR